MTQITDSDREAAAMVRPNSHNSHLILKGERDGTDIVKSAMFGRIQSTTAMAAEIERLKSAIEPVRHWYESDEQPSRDNADILADIVADLQSDRAENLQLRREKAEAVELLREAGATSVRLEYTPAWHARRRTFLGQQAIAAERERCTSNLQKTQIAPPALTEAQIRADERERCAAWLREDEQGRFVEGPEIEETFKHLT